MLGFSVWAPDGPSDQKISPASRNSNRDLIAIASEPNLFLGPDQRDGQANFSAPPDEKRWNQWRRQGFYPVAAT